jgi:RNA polymerase sigma factor (sigma-70 family)
LTHALAEHERLVGWVVRRQWLGSLTYADALQVGRIALWRALRGYDPSRGTTFATYAVPSIARAVWRAVALAERHAPEILGARPPQAAPSLETLAQHLLVREALQALLDRLPQPLHTVIVARYGLAGESPQTFAAIGQRLGVTRQRTHQLHTQALLWLAHPAHSLELRLRLERNTLADYRAYLARQRAWARARRSSR